jgi:hypothetical protein
MQPDEYARLRTPDQQPLCWYFFRIAERSAAGFRVSEKQGLSNEAGANGASSSRFE